MRKWLVGLLPLLLVAVACSSANSASVHRSPFWDGAGDVRGLDSRLLIKEQNFDRLVQDADAAVKVKITAIDGVEMPAPLPEGIKVEDPADQWILDRDRNTPDPPVATFYTGAVESWIKGNGDKAISIRGLGGVMSDKTLAYPDGSFLLEPGRTYVLLLDKIEGGHYEYGWARAAFDVTDGVKVLNNPLTRDLEHFETTSVDDFVTYVGSLAKPVDSQD